MEKVNSTLLIFGMCIFAIIYATWSMLYAPSGSWLLLIGMVIVWLVGFITGVVSYIVWKEIKDLNFDLIGQAFGNEKGKDKK